MRPDEPWYAHYFCDDDLVIVFQDAIVRVGTDPETWGPAIEAGSVRGIPREQLDFRPRTRADALEFFELSEKDRQPEPS